MPDLARVRILTDANVTLSGEQTLQGVPLVAGDSVAVAGQDVIPQNGIYTVQTTGWTRRADLDTEAENIPGLDFHVVAGTHAGETWYLSSDDLVNPGVESTVFVRRTHREALRPGRGIDVADGQVSVKDSGVSSEGADVDIMNPSRIVADRTGRVKTLEGGGSQLASLERAPVRLVATADVPTTGTPIIDGVQTVAGAAGLVTSQADAARNGVWVVAAGAWARRADLDASAEHSPGIWVRVLEGATQAGTRWFLRTTGAITLNTTALEWRKDGEGGELVAGAGLQKNGREFSLPERSGVAGSRTNPTITTDERGIITSVSAGSVPTSHREGLQVEYVSANSLRIRAGAAYVPALGRILELASDLTKSGLVLTANTWYYLYLFENAGVADVEIVTTAPASPYRAGARVKGPDSGPDNTRRFLTEVRAKATDTMMRWRDSGDFRLLVEDQSTTLRALAGGTATGSTAIDLSLWVPPTSRLVEVVLEAVFSTSGGGARLHASTDGLDFPAGQSQLAAICGSDHKRTYKSGLLETNLVQNIRYAVANTGMSAFVDVMGYRKG
jgi:hypothetical protein